MTTLHEHAVEVDTRIAELYRTWEVAQGRVASAADHLMYAAGFRSPYSRHDMSWRNRAGERVSLEDAIAYLTDKGNEYMITYGKTGNEILAELTNARAVSDDAQQAYYEASLDYDGWSRFFMVPGGHIHSSMNCSTCNKGSHRTAFGWLPELSGLSEAEAVAANGPVLCTICYPSAPVEWTEGQLNANGEYVAPKAYCAGSNTGDVVGEVGPPRGYNSARYATCAHCNEVVTFTNKGLRKHKAPKAAS
jgi:hypothetical protein